MIRSDFLSSRKTEDKADHDILEDETAYVLRVKSTMVVSLKNQGLSDGVIMSIDPLLTGFAKESYRMFNTPSFREFRERLRSRYYFFFGIAIGVVFGILGNILATHWIEVLKGIVRSEMWWEVNVIAFLGVVCGVVVSVIWAYREIQHGRQTLERRVIRTMLDAMKSAMHSKAKEEKKK